MSLELVAGMLGSQLVQAVASEIVANLACHAITQVITTATATASDAATVPPAVPTDWTPMLRVVPTAEIVSATAGRARLRVLGLRGDGSRAAELSARLLALDGIRSVGASALTGTVLVRYDATLLTVQQIIASLAPARTLGCGDAPEHARPLLHVVGR